MTKNDEGVVINLPITPVDPDVIEQIQRKADGSYQVQCNGYPYHATQQQTPEIYEKVLLLIEQGEPVTEFIEPVPEVPDPQEAANQEYNRLRAVADFAIAPLQDAVDIGEGTEAELLTLKAWKKYRVALSRVHEQEGYPQKIDWPVTP